MTVSFAFRAAHKSLDEGESILTSPEPWPGGIFVTFVGNLRITLPGFPFRVSKHPSVNLTTVFDDILRALWPFPNSSKLSGEFSKFMNRDGDDVSTCAADVNEARKRITETTKQF